MSGAQYPAGFFFFWLYTIDELAVYQAVAGGCVHCPDKIYFVSITTIKA